MKQLPQISDAEWEVMKVLWDKGECTSSEVVNELSESTDWSPKTIRTLLTRLVQKEAVESVQDESRRAHLFRPLISENEYLKSETKSFMKKLFGGAIKPMLANFLEDKKLSAKEINELKELLDENVKNDSGSKKG